MIIQFDTGREIPLTITLAVVLNYGDRCVVTSDLILEFSTKGRVIGIQLMAHVAAEAANDYILRNVDGDEYVISAQTITAIVNWADANAEQLQSINRTQTKE